MNCKQGDLAIVVSPVNGGKIGRCVSRFDGPWTNLPDGTPGWFLDGTVLLDREGKIKRKNVVADKFLRPIRPGDGIDETLVWAGKPEGAKA